MKGLGIAVFLLLFVSSVSAGITHIDIKEEVVVEKMTYQMSDVADISGSLSSEISKINIGISPKPNYFVVIPAEFLKSSLLKKLPNLGPNISWGGSKQVKIKSVGKELPFSLLEKVSSTALSEWLDHRYAEHEITVVPRNTKVVVPSGLVAFQSHITEVEKARKRMAVWVDIFVDDELYQTSRVWFQVSAKDTVYVMKRTLEKSQSLGEETYTDVVDVTSFEGVPFQERGSLSQYRSIVGLPAGKVLTKSMVEKIPLISKGDTINVLASVAGVNINTKAVALKSGNIRDEINILNPTTKIRYTGIVVGKNRVKVK